MRSQNVQKPLRSVVEKEVVCGADDNSKHNDGDDEDDNIDTNKQQV